MSDRPAGVDQSDPVTRVPLDPLKQLLADLFVRKGMFAVEAETAAQRIVESQLWGEPEHGIRAVPKFLEAMDAGDIDPRAQVLTLQETPAIALLDGSKGLGHVAATRAMRLAIRKAGEVGTGTVVVKNGQPPGTPAVYVLLAAEAGLIGHCVTSSAGATQPAFGSAGPVVGELDYAWNIPTRSGSPLVVCSTAGGELGFALSALAGPLAGGRFPLRKTRPPFVENSEHYFYVIDPAQFGDRDRFHRELDATLAALRSASPEAIRLPGEAGWRRIQQSAAEGVAVNQADLESLAVWTARCKLAVPW